MVSCNTVRSFESISIAAEALSKYSSSVVNIDERIEQPDKLTALAMPKDNNSFLFI